MLRTLCSNQLLACAIAIGLASTAHAQPAAPPHNNTVYEVFIRSFYDADSDAQHVGDLRGLTQKLDYLNDGKPQTDTDLEVGILWLMPSFPTRTYHGYDVTDYRDVNPEYGTLDDMKNLVREAHQRGVRVILDVPFNHTSTDHAWFKQAVENVGDFRGYYQIENDDGPRKSGWHPITDSRGTKLRYFGVFGANMPDLNWSNPKVRQEVKDVAKFWLDLGIDGFRLDAAKHLAGESFRLTPADQDQNNAWWREFSDFVATVNPKAVLIGEVLGAREELIKHAWGLDGLLDEPFMNEARTQVVQPKDGFIAGWKDFVAKAEAANPNVPFRSFPYLASHDRNPRLASDLQNNAPQTADAAYRAAMCILLSTAKCPMLYYGDEIAQAGWKWNGAGPGGERPGDGTNVWDETLREPLPWYASSTGPGETAWQPKGQPNFLPKFDKPGDGVSVEEQQGNPGSILSLVRALTNLRNALPPLADGEIGEVLTDTKEWMVFERVLDTQRCLVLINLTSEAQPYRFHSGFHPEYQTSDQLFVSDGQGKSWQNLMSQPQRIQDAVQVPAFGMSILRPR